MRSHLRALFPQVEPVYQSTLSRFENPPCGLLIEHSWPLREVPLEVTIGEILIQGPSTLGIVRSDSPHNLLLGEGLAIAKMGIIKEGEKKIKETILEAKKDVTHKSMPEEKS
ncbi:hypothetical protein Tco_0345012 [Tanacetum coccineum]